MRINKKELVKEREREAKLNNKYFKTLMQTFSDGSQYTLQCVNDHNSILMTKFSSSAPISMSLYTQSMTQCPVQPINQPRITIQDHSTIKTLGINLLNICITLIRVKNVMYNKTEAYYK